VEIREGDFKILHIKKAKIKDVEIVVKIIGKDCFPV
jgi:hypothetical protein